MRIWRNFFEKCIWLGKCNLASWRDTRGNSRLAILPKKRIDVVSSNMGGFHRVLRFSLLQHAVPGTGSGTGTGSGVELRLGIVQLRLDWI